MDKIDEIKKYKMPISISRCLLRNYRLLVENYGIYKEQLDNIFALYGVKDSEGILQYGDNHLPLIDNQYKTEFESELNELLNLDINVPFETFSDSLLDSWDDEKYDVLSADDLEVLYIMAISSKEEKNVQSNNTD